MVEKSVKSLLSLIAGLTVAAGVERSAIPNYYVESTRVEVERFANSGNSFQELAAKIEYTSSRYGCDLMAFLLGSIGCYALLSRRKTD